MNCTEMTLSLKKKKKSRHEHTVHRVIIISSLGSFVYTKKNVAPPVVTSSTKQCSIAKGPHSISHPNTATQLVVVSGKLPNLNLHFQRRGHYSELSFWCLSIRAAWSQEPNKWAEISCFVILTESPTNRTSGKCRGLHMVRPTVKIGIKSPPCHTASNVENTSLCPNRAWKRCKLVLFEQWRTKFSTAWWNHKHCKRHMLPF